MCSGTFVSVGPLLVRVGSDRLIATKWFYDSLLRYPARGSVSTLPGEISVAANASRKLKPGALSLGSYLAPS
jgi:hypothetical protein